MLRSGSALTGIQVSSEVPKGREGLRSQVLILSWINVGIAVLILFDMLHLVFGLTRGGRGVLKNIAPTT
jgi:hypothetical protein